MILTKACCVLFMFHYCFAGIGANVAHALYSSAGASLNKSFKIGAFSRPLLSVPVKIELAVPEELSSDGTVLAVMELDDEGREIGMYPCWTSPAVREGYANVEFIPFSGGAESKWEAGKERQFVIRRMQNAVSVMDPLVVVKKDDAVEISNKHYAVSLDDPDQKLPRSAGHLFRAITFRKSNKKLAAVRMTSDIWDEGKSYFWRCDPDCAPKVNQVGDYIYSFEYEGEFLAGKEELEGLRWRIAFTFYHSIPLIKVAAEIVQDVSLPATYNLCRLMQLHFNPADENVPLKEVERINGGRRDYADLLAAYGPGAFLGLINSPFSEDDGTVYMNSKRTWAFLCGVWSSQITDVTSEYFLLVTGDLTQKEAMEDYWWSLMLLEDINARIKLRKLFE